MMTEVTKMDQQEIDVALHDCMTTIWKAYRSGDVKAFNECFKPLYDKYDESMVHYFICCMGMGLASAITWRKNHENQNQ